MRCPTCKDPFGGPGSPCQPCTAPRCGHTVCGLCGAASAMCVPPVCVLCGVLAPEWVPNDGLARVVVDAAAAAAEEPSSPAELAGLRAQLDAGAQEAKRGHALVEDALARVRQQAEVALLTVPPDSPGLLSKVRAEADFQRKALEDQAAELQARAAVLEAGVSMCDRVDARLAVTCAAMLAVSCVPFTGPCVSGVLEVVLGPPAALRRLWADVSRCTAETTSSSGPAGGQWCVLMVSVVDDCGRLVADAGPDDVDVVFEGGPGPLDARPSAVTSVGCVTFWFRLRGRSLVTVRVRGEAVSGWTRRTVVSWGGFQIW